MRQLGKVFLVSILMSTLAMPKVYALMPSSRDVFEDVVTSLEASGELDASDSQALIFIVEDNDLPLPEGWMPEAIDSAAPIDALSVLEAEDLELALEGKLFEPSVESRFWTTGKILFTSTAAVATGMVMLLVVLFSGSGSSGSAPLGGGGGGAGGGFVPPSLPPAGLPLTPTGIPLGGPAGDGPVGGFLPTGKIVTGFPDGNAVGNPLGQNLPARVPSNPEPSTMLLMTLGLFLPFFRRKK